jgi:CheY-like chemotaxis protein
MKQLKKILLVDDEPAAIFISQRVFRQMGLEVDLLTARHGREALDIVREVCQSQGCPELILLDIHMPVMDGFEFLEELQQSADLSSTPLQIVLLSSSKHELDVAKAKEYPVIDFIQKPLTAEKLSKFLR